MMTAPTTKPVCRYNSIAGCDDGTAEAREIYKGDNYLGWEWLCAKCRAQMLFDGFELIIAGDGRDS